MGGYKYKYQIKTKVMCSLCKKQRARAYWCSQPVCKDCYRILKTKKL